MVSLVGTQFRSHLSKALILTNRLLFQKPWIFYFSLFGIVLLHILYWWILCNFSEPCRSTILKICCNGLFVFIHQKQWVGDWYELDSQSLIKTMLIDTSHPHTHTHTEDVWSCFLSFVFICMYFVGTVLIVNLNSHLILISYLVFAGHLFTMDWSPTPINSFIELFLRRLSP